MARYYTWEEDLPSTSQKSGGNGIDYLKLEIGKKYKLRLVLKYFAYFQHWEPIICRSPEIDAKTGETLDPLMLQGIQPKPRYAIWVIDRTDGKLKLMDFPGTILEQFRAWKDNFNDDPGGPKGPDWVIEGKCPGGDRRKTKWNCAYLDRTPFTQEEVDAIKSGNLQARLEEARKPNTPDEIRKKLADKHGIDGGAPVATKQASVSATPVKQATAPASTDGIDF